MEIEELEIYKQLKEKNLPEEFIKHVVHDFFRALNEMQGLPDIEELVEIKLMEGTNLKIDGDYLVFFNKEKEIARIYAPV